MRRLAALVVPVVALVLAVPASASPVSTGRIASARFQLEPSSGVRLEVEVTALASSAGDRVEVSVQRCEAGSCAYPSYYAGALAPGAVKIDPKTAAGKLRAHVAGVRLALDWAPVPPGTVVVQDTHGGGTDGDMAFTVSRVDPAAAHVVLDGNGCKGPGSVGDEVRVEVPEGSSGGDLPLRRLTLPAVAPVCGG